MTMTIGILIIVCSILAGWFAGRYWELTIWITRRTPLSVLRAEFFVVAAKCGGGQIPKLVKAVEDKMFSRERKPSKAR